MLPLDRLASPFILSPPPPPPDPTFVHAHLIPDSGEKNDDKLYFFFREKASEVGQSPMTQSRIGRICLVSLITAVGETCRRSSPLKGLYVPHNGQSRPCVFLSAGSFPLIAGNCRAPSCNAHQQRGRKQKSALSASAAKFGSGAVLLFQLLGMKWSSERVANPGQARRRAPWRRCLKWHFNRERCADMSYRHKRGVFEREKRPFVGIVFNSQTLCC